MYAVADQDVSGIGSYSRSLSDYLDDISDCEFLSRAEERLVFSELREIESSLDDLLLRTGLGRSLVRERVQGVLDKRFRDYTLFIYPSSEADEDGEDDVDDCRFTHFLGRMDRSLGEGQQGGAILEGFSLEPLFRKRIVRAIARSGVDRYGEIASLDAQRDSQVSGISSHYYPFVISIAKRYKSRGLPPEDLNQKGNIGMLKAIDRFDPARGTRFTSYSARWIRQEIIRGIVSDSRIVEIKYGASLQIYKMGRAECLLFARDGVENPSDEQLAEELKWSVDKVKKVRGHSLLSSVHSLDRQVRNDGPEGSRFLNLVEDDYIPSPDESAASFRYSRIVKKVVAGMLNARHRKVLEMRFGLNGHESHTLKEVGEVLGVNRERVRQIQEQVLANIRFNPELMQLAIDEGLLEEGGTECWRVRL